MKLCASNSATRTSTREAIRKPTFAAMTLRRSPLQRDPPLFDPRREAKGMRFGESERLETGRGGGEALESPGWYGGGRTGFGRTVCFGRVVTRQG